MDIRNYARFEYSQTQDEILNKLLTGETCLLLGFPGSGKTKMTATIADILISTYGKKVAVTGSTGAAPQHIEKQMSNHDKIVPQTVHSFFQITPSDLEVLEKSAKSFEDMIKWQQYRPEKSRQSLVECDILIIDEISMLTSTFIRAMNTIAKMYRKKMDQNFGGLTLLLVGDFRQLPPVGHKRYLFLSPLWEKWIDNTFSLNFILRQDKFYADLIMKMSHNKLTKNDKQVLISRIVKDGKIKIMDPNFLPNALRVFHTNSMVNLYNNAVTKLAKESGISCHAMKMKWHFPRLYTKEMKETTKRDILGKIFYSPELFIGARIILTTNFDVKNGIVNGSTGTLEGVTECCDDMYGGDKLGLCFIVKLDSGKCIKVGSQTYEFYYINMKEKKGTVDYIPLLLSHAMTVHRLQGNTIDIPIFYWPFDTKEYNNSHFYVVCTRVTSLDLLYLVNIPKNIDVVVNPVVINFYDQLFKDRFKSKISYLK